jgi:hypothetical protein
MNWTDEEIAYLLENYSKRVHIDELCSRLKRTRRSIRHKALRLGFNRRGMLVKKLGDPTPRNIIDKRYYLKNKSRIYAQKLGRRRKLKLELIQLLGGKCNICGYSKSPAAFDFHHAKGDKENLISIMIKDSSKEKLLKEANKCILLCANCHRELHHKDP